MKNYFSVCMIIMLFTSFDSPKREGNRLEYQIWIGDKLSGTLSVEKFSLGEHEYTFRAETNIDFLFWDIRSVIESKYRNHQLWSACAKEKVNGKDKDCTQTIWTDNAYQITKNKAKSVSKELILYSVVMLYHHEPQQLSRIFAERHTKYCTIKEVTPHCYELTAPNGDKNYYSYENGICKEMQTCIMMKTIKFVLVKR